MKLHNNNTDNRLFNMDLIRFIAIFLVILQHSWSMLGMDDDTSGWASSLYAALSKCNVPLFLMISGFFQISKPMPIATFYGKRFARLLVPFLVWGTIAYIISVVLHKYSDIGSIKDAIVMYIPYILSGRINASYWYIYLIAGIYLVTPFLQSAANGTDNTEKLFLCGTIIWLSYFLFLDIYPQFALAGYFQITGKYLGYYITGFYMYRYLLEHIRKGTFLIVFIISLVLNALLIQNGIKAQTVQIIEVLALFGILAKTHSNNNVIQSVVNSVSRYSYTIYLTQFLTIGFLYAALPTVFPFSPITPLTAAITVLVIEAVGCWILEKIRFIPGKITGIS